MQAQGAGSNCSGPRSSCNNEAQAGYDLCLSHCNGDASCQSQCATTKNQDTANCTAAYNSCMRSNSEYCATSGCQIYCSQTTGVTSAAWNDGANQCDCMCGCPLPAPNCPSPQCLGNGWTCNSPILIDVKDEGFHLTSPEKGVMFDFDGNGMLQKLAWTDPAYNNAWLALDRNNNGRIDNATELFGNLTPQPQSDSPNGFRALAAFDKPENGGNGDGVINSGDSIYPKLLLWIDANHNGVSEPDELHSLAEMHVAQIDLRYWQQDKTDQYGNLFRYKAKIYDEKGYSGSRFTWDVFLEREVAKQ